MITRLHTTECGSSAIQLFFIACCAYCIHITWSYYRNGPKHSFVYNIHFLSTFFSAWFVVILLAPVHTFKVYDEESNLIVTRQTGFLFERTWDGDDNEHYDKCMFGDQTLLDSSFYRHSNFYKIEAVSLLFLVVTLVSRWWFNIDKKTLLYSGCTVAKAVMTMYVMLEGNIQVDNRRIETMNEFNYPKWKLTLHDTEYNQVHRVFECTLIYIVMVLCSYIVSTTEEDIETRNKKQVACDNPALKKPLL